MSSLLWSVGAWVVASPGAASGLAALFEEACGRVVPCECCRGVTVGCFCQATAVFYGVAAARQRLAEVVARCNFTERGGEDVAAALWAAIDVLVAAEEEFDEWWDENAEARAFLDTLSPSERGMAWRWRLQREVLVSMLSFDRRTEQQAEDAGGADDDA